MPPEIPRYLTPNQVARALDFRCDYVRELIATGKIPAVRLSARALRVSTVALRAFVDARTAEANRVRAGASPRDLAVTLGVTAATVRRLIRRGTLTATTGPGGYRVHHDAVAALLAK
jgi:excisionase family DNA binding protein